MTTVALVSAKGAPGTTTLALALAATSSGTPALLIEADEAGASLPARFSLDPERGMSSLYRRDYDADSLSNEIQMISLGGEVPAVPVIAGVPSEGRRSRLKQYWDGFSAAYSSDQHFVIDCGRYMVESPLQSVFTNADVVLFVTRTSIEDVFHTETLIRRLKNAGLAERSGVVLVGDEPYRRDEVEGSLSVPVLGVIPKDAKTAAVLSGLAVPPNKFAKAPLLKAATELHTQIVAWTTQVEEKSA